MLNDFAVPIVIIMTWPMCLNLKKGDCSSKFMWMIYIPKILNLVWSAYFNDIVASHVTKEGKPSDFYSLDMPAYNWVNSKLNFSSWCWNTSEGHSVLSKTWKSLLHAFAANSSILKPCKLISSKMHCDIWNPTSYITQGKQWISLSWLKLKFRLY